ncbi:MULTISPECIES: ATP-binding cassette domain-containing protein [unclassified Prochlorococcus]|uniref:ATP-binding cassette domain-containing protein n=1 Tax=unclassified Prochlorococcus TaxID=2627481 RepID=UPI00053397F1|nr:MULTISPECIES: ATP-binding cassette domain-containing protein [unclassified Prochlorococcus]KGG29503.1 transport ATP-binding protein CydC [Prochlorococcus sp. MIT 0701]KGG30353.1 transport ATP-binding protein CydC [Prochlorococcus sp. MIT 0702]KGG35771.1 transport ATP-binding protein CydC [Prochlorococcus sp. MIT 0703]
MRNTEQYWLDHCDALNLITQDPVLCIGMNTMEIDLIKNQIDRLQQQGKEELMHFMNQRMKLIALKFEVTPTMKALASLPMKVLIIDNQTHKWCYLNSYQSYRKFIQIHTHIQPNCEFYSLTSSLPKRALTKLELSWWHIFARWQGYSLTLIGLAIFTLLSTLPVLAIGPIFDQIIPTGQLNQLILICCGLFASQIIATFFKTISNISIGIAQSSIDFHGLIGLMERYLSVRPSSIPQLSLSLWEQIFKTALAFTSSARALLISLPIAFLTIGIYMVIFGFYLLEPRLVLLILLLSSLPAWISLLSGYITGRISFQLIRTQAECNQLIVDTIRSISEIRSLSLETSYDQTLINSKRKYFKTIISINQWSSYGILFSRVFSSLLVALILFSYSQNLGLSQGKYLVMFTAFSFISSGFSQVAEAISSLMIALPTYFSKNSLRGMTQFEQLQQPWMQTTVDTRKVREIETIELNQIAYKYTNSRFNIISNLNFIFEKDKNYAITGKPGSGKSTLLKLMGGLHESSEGNIIINNTLLSENQGIKHFTDIMFIPQIPVLFGSTIRDFLDPSESFDDELISRALNDCDCLNVIESLAMGLNTNLSESSQDLSNAELQCLHVARVVLGKPTILLTDEPTSYLDEISHLSLIDALNKASSIHITSLHRLSARNCFDAIIDMNLYNQNPYTIQESL